MRTFKHLTLCCAGGLALCYAHVAMADDDDHGSKGHRNGDMKGNAVQVGSRPAFLVNGMDSSPLKRRLKQCHGGPFYRTDFSIGHRGAALQFPEHTEESYRAAASQGAGIIECDATFTNDGELVCRHAQCDLHTTTNIITTDLNAECTVPWDPENPNPGSVKCCASDLSLAEFKTLKGKMDGSNPNANTADEFMGGTVTWRTDLYASRGTVLSHKDSIRLIRELGAKFTPELKAPDPNARVQVEDVFGSREAYAQKLIDDYKEFDVDPRDVWAQSFSFEDVQYWIDNEPRFGRQAVYLDGRYSGSNAIDPVDGDPATFVPTMEEIAAKGVQILAPPIHFLLTVRDDGKIVPSKYARAAKSAGLDIVAWTFERSDLRNGSRTGVDANGKPTATFYFAFDVNPNAQAINKDSDMYKALDILARKVGILGIFSDWPATVTFYANCMGLK